MGIAAGVLMVGAAFLLMAVAGGGIANSASASQSAVNSNLTGSTTGAAQNVGSNIHAAYAKLGLGRLDQGVDFGNPGAVPAVLDGVVTRVGLWPGWPGSGGVVYKTAQGNIYVMEHFSPSVHVGQQVKAGDVLGQAIAGYPYIETGFANSAGTAPLTPYNGAPDGTPMPGAYRFKKLLGF